METKDALARAISERGWSQADLCRRTGIPSSAMSRYLSGESDITLSRAIAIADAMAISLDELVGRTPPKRVIERELLAQFRELSDEGQEIAVNTVRGLAMSYKKRAASVLVEEAGVA